MFKKSLPLALVAIAGCVALAPTAQKSDSTAQSQAPTSAPTAPTAQKASPTPVPISTPTPTPSPTPTPTPLPDNILKINFVPVEGVPGLAWGIGGHVGKNHLSDPRGHRVAFSALGDMYIQSGIPNESILLLCPTCDTNIVPGYLSYAIYKKTNVKGEFEFVAMGEKKRYGDEWMYVPSKYIGKIYYEAYSRYDFTFSKLAEVASVSMAPWVVKSVDFAKKEISFDTSVWPQNTGNLILSDVASGDFFGQDYDNYKEGANSSEPRCENVECENERALAIARERTAFTGTTAYFVGRAKSSKTDAGGGLYHDISKVHTIFRVSKTGAKEIVGKNIAAHFAKDPFPLIHNFVYSRADGVFYIITRPEGYDWTLYRVSEDALVP